MTQYLFVLFDDMSNDKAIRNYTFTVNTKSGDEHLNKTGKVEKLKTGHWIWISGNEGKIRENIKPTTSSRGSTVKQSNDVQININWFTLF